MRVVTHPILFVSSMLRADEVGEEKLTIMEDEEGRHGGE